MSDEKRVRVRIEVGDIPAFGAYLSPSACEGEAIIYLNLSACAAAALVDGPEAAPQSLREILASTACHEILHALQDVFQVALSEADVAEILADAGDLSTDEEAEHHELIDQLYAFQQRNEQLVAALEAAGVPVPPMAAGGGR